MITEEKRIKIIYYDGDTGLAIISMLSYLFLLFLFTLCYGNMPVGAIVYDVLFAGAISTTSVTIISLTDKPTTLTLMIIFFILSSTLGITNILIHLSIIAHDVSFITLLEYIIIPFLCESWVIFLIWASSVSCHSPRH